MHTPRTLERAIAEGARGALRWRPCVPANRISQTRGFGFSTQRHSRHLMSAFDPSALRVLTIDDDPLLRMTLAAVLRAHGVTQVDEAADGDAAYDLLKQRGPVFDLIFCDLQMPGRDGIDLLRSLPEVARHTAIVFLSGEDERVLASVAALARSKGLPVLSTMAKPITVEKVREVLAALATERPAPVAERERPTITAEQAATVMEKHALALHYQPKVRLADRVVVGFEALIRAEHPELGMLPAEMFIEAAELAGYTEAIAMWTIREGIACAARWKAAGFETGVAINLSGRALAQLDLPDMIASVAIAAGVSPDKITLEITETQLAADHDAAVDITSRLRLKRFNVSIDDFGIGVSGMRQLQQMPFTEMKIDRKFVDRCDADNSNRSIVQAAVGLASALGMQVVGEGIERAEEWTTLAALGCDVAQGHWIARAMVESSVLGWVAEWQVR